MRKMLLLWHTLFACLLVNAQGRLLDQPMQIKKISMSVKADCFTAVSFVEMEFFNHRDQEIEGLFRFSLQPGQVITAFQLDLNGKFRDGSIEEKWKATNAYNTIVGKRIDPALITQESKDHYRLNIYPVPARSSRRITMTIHEKLVKQNGRLLYRFGFNKKDSAKQFDLTIKTSGCGSPRTEKGMILHQPFMEEQGGGLLEWKAGKQSLDQPIAFSMEAVSNVYCTQQKDGKTFFAARISQQVPETLPLSPRKLLVYWDVSGSGLRRNLARETSFLKQYMQRNNTGMLTLVTFGETTSEPRVFYPRDGRDWIDFINKLQYDGVTRMDQLNIGNQDHDAVMVFSDGFQSYGAALPGSAYKPLFTISSSLQNNTVFLKNLPGNSGGSFIDLSRLTVPQAIELGSQTSNKLLDIQSSNGSAVFEYSRNANEWLVYGELQKDDTLTFIYGNRQAEYARKQFSLRKNGGCRAWGIDRYNMLENISTKNPHWEDLLEFGMEQKIVTQYTAYIVLERIEDYIRYQITPPKELEAACAEQGYITRSFKSKKKTMRELDAAAIINGVLNHHNNQLALYGHNPNSIALETKSPNHSSPVASSSMPGGNLDGKNSMEEVVVVAYGNMRKSAFTGSVGYYHPRQMVAGNDLAQVLSGRVPGVVASPQSNGIAGSSATISIRGMSSISGNNQPLYVLNGIPLDGNVNDFISVDDIESVTVLKDGASAALYGSRAVNGVILITSKKYRNRGSEYGKYRLRDMEDEDYLVRLNETSLNLKWAVYQEMRLEYGEHPNYYLDVAQHFFENGLVAHATKIILNAAEVSNGESSVLRAIAYSFESWKLFDKSSEIYRNLLMNEPKNLGNYSDLAWSLYQQGKIEEAVRLLYTAITLNMEEYENHYLPVKSKLLNDMNAMISIHNKDLDFSFVPSTMLNPMPVDLRIVVTSSNSYDVSARVKEPGGAICNQYRVKTKNGGYLMNQYYGSSIEYNIKNAMKGKYRISLQYYGGYKDLPMMYRIITYRGFGSSNQQIEVRNVMMNNQYGDVEIGEVEWFGQ